MGSLYLTILLACLVTANAEKMRFDNYTLYRVTPQHHNALNIFNEWEEKGQTGIYFWSSVTSLNNSLDVMVSPDFSKNIEELEYSKVITSKVLMKNVQDYIDNEGFRKFSSIGTFGWTNYYTLDEIHGWLRNLPRKYPGIVELKIAGESYEERPILGVKVSFSNTPKKTVFIEGNIHAREWISSAVSTYILNELLTSNNSTIRALAERYDWYIFPVTNPDGFVYSHTTDRMWRKTRVPYGICYGADPNRNWGYRWNTGGTSDHPCSEIYCGPRPYSEPSVSALAKFVSQVAETEDLLAYLSIHSYSQMILLPYGYTSEHLDNYYPMMEVLQKTKDALARRYGTQYVVGNSAEVLYVTTGDSTDWVKGTYGVPIVLTYELRDLGEYGFLLPANQIIPTGEETLESFVVLLNEGERIVDYSRK